MTPDPTPAPGPPAPSTGTAAGRPDPPPTVLTQIRDVIAVLTGAAVLVYVTGSGILALRLMFEQLPAMVVVGSIPREVALSIGISTVLVPALALGTLFIVAAAIANRTEAPAHHIRVSGSPTTPVERLSLPRHRRELLAGTVLTAAPAFAWSLASGYELSWTYISVLIPLSAGFIVTLGYIHFRARIAEHWPGVDYAKPIPTLLRASLFALACVPMLVALAASERLEPVRMCLAPAADGSEAGRTADGFFIGATSDFVYIGDNEDRRRITAFPISVASRFIVGPGSDTASCT